MNKKNDKINNKKIELSLSAIMFFSPLINNMINKDEDINKNDKKFIKGFIKIGNINIFLMITYLILQIIYYKFNFNTLNYVNNIILRIIGLSLITNSFLAITNKPILSKFQNNNKNDITEIIKKYIPLYNVFLRYKEHNFDNPDNILKESIIFWGLFSILLMIFSKIIILLILITIFVIRIITISNNIYLGDNKFINNLYYKNPEEVRGYISGFIKSLFNKESITYNIKQKKKEFELLFKTSHKQIVFEYLIFVIIIIIGLYYGYNNKNFIFFVTIIIIGSKYLLMLINLKHLPHLPIIKDITNIFFYNQQKKGDS